MVDVNDLMFLPRGFPPEGHGGGGKSEALKGWEALINGRTVGKAVNIQTSSTLDVLTRDMLEISGADANGVPLTVTFSSPKLMNTPAGTFDVNNLQGPFQDNVEVLSVFAANPTFYGPAGNGPLYTDVQAEVEWGTGGISNKVIVDIGNGACININASFVRVRAMLRNTASIGENRIYQVAASVAPGHSKWVAGQFTQPLGDWDTGDETTVFAVPRYARRVTVLGLNNSATPGPIFVGSIRFWRNPNGPTLGTMRVGEYTFAGNAPNEVSLPVPNGAYFYTVVSQLATPNNLFAIFDLAI